MFGFGIAIILLFSSCGDVNLFLSGNRNYQISARIGDNSLDNYALIKKDEKVQPFFVSPPRDDPDAAALSISLKTAGGITVGRSYHYILKSAYKPDFFETENGDIFLLDRFGTILPSFSINDEIKLGPYIMVFEVLGRNQALISKNEKSIYYMGGEDFQISDINAYLPAFSLPSHFIPPETVVLLEAVIAAGENLDPYIFWYNGRSIIAEGKLSDGANRILWQLPPETGFQNIRADVIPFPPMHSTALVNDTRLTGMQRGKAKELSLPASSRDELRGALWDLFDIMEENERGIIQNSFRFGGNLNDSVNLLPANVLKGGSPRWYPVGEVYGLQTGPEDIWQFSFMLNETTSGETTANAILDRASLALRFCSLSDGIHFGICFDHDETEIAFLRKEDSFFIVSDSAEADEGEHEFSGLPALDDAFINLILDFAFNDGNIIFSIRDDEDKTLYETNIKFSFKSDSQIMLQFGDAGFDLPKYPTMVLGELSFITFEPAASVETAGADGYPEAL